MELNQEKRNMHIAGDVVAFMPDFLFASVLEISVKIQGTK